jgi:hypothetical protein
MYVFGHKYLDHHSLFLIPVKLSPLLHWQLSFFHGDVVAASHVAAYSIGFDKIIYEK